jgi:hypothetical protein
MDALVGFLRPGLALEVDGDGRDSGVRMPVEAERPVRLDVHGIEEDERLQTVCKTITGRNQAGNQP